MLGAVISTLYGRITSLGLADIRGAVHAGFDEGAWIPTAATVAQMFIGPPAAWLGMVLGVRRVLMASAIIFGIASALIPFSPNLETLLFGQVVAGLACGTFIPLAIGFVIRNLPPAWWPYGIAAYGLNLELSLNIPASLEGFYLDQLSWRWIFWQGALLAAPMVACVAYGMPRQPVDKLGARMGDGWGMLHASIGFSLVYAALDQGNRLDWLNSGLICGLLAGGTVMIAAFIVREVTAPNPWLRPSLLLDRNLVLIAGLLVLYRFVLLATALLIPQYLTTVQDFRSLQVGRVLIWVALPQFLLAPLIAALLTRVDPRIVFAAGMTAIGVACLMCTQITGTWQTGEFLPSQILQACGQSMALISLVLFAVRNMRPADALALGTILQTSRLLGGELGSAFMQTYLRVAEQANSYLLGLHVQSGSGLVQERLAKLTAAFIARASSAVEAPSQAVSALSLQVRQQATILAIADGFTVAALAVILALVLSSLLRPSSGSR
nr:MFS transporter [Roseomonas marmotae]